MPLYPGEVQADQGNPGSSAWPVVFGSSSTATITVVPASATSVTILAANANRKGASVFNSGSKNLFLSMAASSSVTDFTVELMANSYFEVPFNYTGIITGIWSAASGNAQVTEYT